MGGFLDAPQYSTNGKYQVTLACIKTCISVVFEYFNFYILWINSISNRRQHVAYYIITIIICTSNIVNEFNIRIVSVAMALDRVTCFSAGNRTSEFCGRLFRSYGGHMLQQMAARLERLTCVAEQQCSLWGVRTTSRRL